MNQCGMNRFTPRFFPTRFIELNTKTKPTGDWKVAVWFQFWWSTQTKKLIKTKKKRKKTKRRTTSSLLLLLLFFFFFSFSLLLHLLPLLLGPNQCLCLPKARLITKKKPNGHFSMTSWFRSGAQLYYSCHKKTRREPVHAALVHLLICAEKLFWVFAW